MGRECHILFYGEEKRVGVRYGGSFFHRDARRDNEFKRMFPEEGARCPFITEITGKRPACAVRRVMIRPAPDSRCRIDRGIKGFRSKRLLGEIRL